MMKKHLLFFLFFVGVSVCSFGQGGRGKYATLKGMVDGGFIVIPNQSEQGVEFTGNFGYQFNRYLYLGVGGGVYKLFGESDLFVPLYANVRINPLKPRIAPYADVRVGFIANDTDAAYISMGGGIRVKSGKTPITFGAYYSALFRGFYDGGEVGSHYDGLVLRLGVEF